MKDHQIAQLVNDLRDIAIQYGQTQQLRERIHRRLVPELNTLRLKLANLEESMAARAEHEDLAPHEGCTCRLCELLIRNEVRQGARK